MKIVKFIILIAAALLLLLFIVGLVAYYKMCACGEIKPSGTAKTNVITIR